MNKKNDLIKLGIKIIIFAFFQLILFLESNLWRDVISTRFKQVPTNDTKPLIIIATILEIIIGIVLILINLYQNSKKE